jgi:hypothetical protein
MSVQLPKMVKIKQHLSGPSVEDIESAISRQLYQAGLQEKIQPGMRIAITAGSRGIANIPRIIRTLVVELKKMGAEPFIVPTMGSHGGATAEGQVEVLKSLHLTEESCGAPILSSMEVVEVGQTSKGMPVYVDKYAWEADGILLAGRIKPHTDFKAPLESGLMKMAAIGLGKHKQALLIHTYGVVGMQTMMPEVAEVVLQKANVLCGLAILENAFEQTARIEAIPTHEIASRERELLKEAKDLMPKLPVKQIDVLVVDEIGKNFSGTGLDTNIIGRLRIQGMNDPNDPHIKYIIASDLSEESHGNATGIGLADITTERLFKKINFQKTNENVITSNFLHRAMIPIVLENDREALLSALRANWGVDPSEARVIQIANTLFLEEMYVSESIYREIKDFDHIEVLGKLEEIKWDESGNYFLK